jgi:RNA polymerase sigma factor (sigma-70 family)
LAGSSTRTTREQQFLSVLPDLERVIGWVCARRGLRGDDAEDFASVVKCRLIENDYEVLAKFEGRCTLLTFLTVVVTRLYLDFQVRRFGKWRNSAQARRLGAVAMRLECLLHRDKLSFEEACGVLGSDPSVKEGREALHEISLRLPPRLRPREQAASLATGVAAPVSSDVERSERQRLADRTFAVIESTLGRLPAADRVFIRLHLAQGMTVAEAARSLHLNQQALYRRKEQLFSQLRAELAAAGIEAKEVKELLSAVDWEAQLLERMASSEDTGSKPVGSRPSSQWTGAAREEGES